MQAGVEDAFFGFVPKIPSVLFDGVKKNGADEYQSRFPFYLTCDFFFFSPSNCGRINRTQISLVL